MGKEKKLCDSCQERLDEGSLLNSIPVAFAAQCQYYLAEDVAAPCQFSKYHDESGATAAQALKASGIKGKNEGSMTQGRTAYGSIGRAGSE